MWREGLWSSTPRLLRLEGVISRRFEATLQALPHHFLCTSYLLHYLAGRAMERRSCRHRRFSQVALARGHLNPPRFDTLAPAKPRISPNTARFSTNPSWVPPKWTGNTRPTVFTLPASKLFHMSMVYKNTKNPFPHTCTRFYTRRDTPFNPFRTRSVFTY